MLTETTTAVLEGIVETMNIISGIVRGALTTIIVRPVLVARASVDPLNWDLNTLPVTTRTDIRVLGLYLWARLEVDNPDRFVANIGRSPGSHPIPPDLLRAIARGMSETTTAGTLFNIEFTPDLLRQLTPLTFVQLLRDWRLLSFRQDPERIADAALSAQAVP